ncbi:polymer-forming cytoskeletal protein [Candidatus Aminicenantes bacterium AC-334-K16]|jgi:cytoskeletal protein CcmA (bactofilin family)|nr:polymer-forming cytoskeletal protein [Candidatus Aminicenantes bacterium AC-334-K16]
MPESNKPEGLLSSTATHLSIIARETVFDGKIQTNNELIIHGQFKGTLHLPGNTLIIEKTAKVEATAEARAVILRGYFKGDILAGEKVVIESGARMEGRVESPRLAIEEKAQFKGRIKMRKKATLS